MKTFEYKVIKYRVKIGGDLAELNDLGAKGWQMVRFIGATSDTTSRMQALFMREIAIS